MSAIRKPIYANETADEYGRREECLRNYQKTPFCFQQCISYFQTTVENLGKDGLVPQTGLRAIELPQPGPIGDILDDTAEDEARLSSLLDDSLEPQRIPSLLSELTSLKSLVIPVEALDLGSRPETDLLEHLAAISEKRYGDPFNQWLPLSSLKAERDEGLAFPPLTARLQSLLQREVDRDAITSSEAAIAFEHEACGLPATESHIRAMAHDIDDHFQPKAFHYDYAGQLTPPLSPVSDDGLPFIPEGTATIIDLVSEPSTPVGKVAQLLRDDPNGGGLDSDPITSRNLLTSSPDLAHLSRIESHHLTVEDTVVEAPLVSTSSDTVKEALTKPIDLPLVTTNEGTVDQQSEVSFCEDAFMSLLEDRHLHISQLSEQERLNPFDSVSRIHVPLLDFNFNTPGWAAYCSNARSHFNWLRKLSPAVYRLPVVPRDVRSESSLKWSPISKNDKNFCIMEDVQASNEEIQMYLSIDTSKFPRKPLFIAIQHDLAILQSGADEEIEEHASDTDTDTDNDPVASVSLLQEEDHTAPKPRTSVENLESSYFKSQDWSNLISPRRRKTIDSSITMLPQIHDMSATSQLLSNFMELRAVKRPKLDKKLAQKSTHSLTPAETKASSSTMDRQKPLIPDPVAALVPALAPEAENPSERGVFIFSLSLGIEILQHLEKSWPSENLIDMDYMDCSRYNIVNPSGPAKPGETTSPLSFDADIPLSPSTGILVTNLLKAKQRPLPGSTALSALRQRTAQVSQKYETVIVLVSESNPSGEFMGAISPSDVAAYADYVGFAISLEGEVNVYFVPGAQGTLAKWIIALLCHYSHNALACKRFLSAAETLWEVFLRRAGMNVVAAKVLSQMLFEQAGPSGLAQFLVMSEQERIARFGQLLGGEKILRSVGMVLDQPWG